MTELYPIVPKNIDFNISNSSLTHILQHHAVSALRISAQHASQQSNLETLLKNCQHYDVALIISLSSLNELKQIPLDKIDGFHLSDAALLAPLITMLPKKYTQQIGVTSHNLDDAMNAGESGADYISFAPELSEFINLWSKITELPCVGEPLATLEDAQIMLQSGADFLGFNLKFDNSDGDYLLQLEKLIALHC